MAQILLLVEAIFVLLLGFVIQRLISWLIRKRRTMTLFSSYQIAGPKPSFWTGNFREYLSLLPHNALDRWSRQFGPVYGYYQGEWPILVLSDVDDIQEVLVKLGRKQFVNRQKPIINVDPFSGSLLNVRGDVWKQSRRVLTPSFTAHKVTLQTTRTIINESVERLMKSIELMRLEGDGHVDLHLQMKRITLDVILRLAFDMNDTDVFDPDNSFVQMIHEFMDQNSNLITEIAAYAPFMEHVLAFAYHHFSNGRLITAIREQMDKCFVNYYKTKIVSHFEGNGQGDETNDKQQPTKVNLLDFMLNEQQNGNLSELQVMGNAVVILLAGYETTASALTFTLYLLATHPEIQHKLREELRQLYGDRYDIAEMNEMSNVRCELMDRVWYESLRLYPPVVSFVTRELDDQLTEIQLASGVTITNRMTVQVPVWTVHHNPDLWPEPNRFDPYRADLPLPGHHEPLTKPAMFLSFGSGPRNCIGANLALSEARTVIASLLLRYSKIELDSNTSDELVDQETGLLKLCCPSVIIQPAKQIKLKFHN